MCFFGLKYWVYLSWVFGAFTGMELGNSIMEISMAFTRFTVGWAVGWVFII